MNAIHTPTQTPVTILDLSDDKLRAYVTTDSLTLFEMRFRRHQGWLPCTSGFLPLAELDLTPKDAQLVADFEQIGEDDAGLLHELVKAGLYADLPPAMTFNGEADEVRPYRPANIDDMGGIPF